MKETGILHPELARVVTEMGHGDLLCIADAGLPIPSGVERIDLAFGPGKPSFIDVFEAVISELRVEAFVLAKESDAGCAELVARVRSALEGAEEIATDHEGLKALLPACRAVVRTGEFTPFANLLLRSGVNFTRR
jgi:D-ribose pyranase